MTRLRSVGEGVDVNADTRQATSYLGWRAWSAVSSDVPVHRAPSNGFLLAELECSVVPGTLVAEVDLDGETGALEEIELYGAGVMDPDEN